eukprot:g4327.t1
MSADGGSGRSRDDDARRGAAASTLSEESSSLSPASRVLAIADQVADEDEQMENGADSEAESDDSLGPGSRCVGKITTSGDSSDRGLRQRGERRGYVQERRGKHKQSSVRLGAAGDLPRSPAESQASSIESWRRALSGDGRDSPRSFLGVDDDGSARAAIDEERLLEGASGTVAELGGDFAEAAVESMSVAELKAKAAELSISTGGRKAQLKARIKQKLSTSSHSPGSIDADGAALAARSSGDTGAAPIPHTPEPNTTMVPSNRQALCDSGSTWDGDSIPEQTPTNPLPPPGGTADLPPLERTATPTAAERESDLDYRAATSVKVSSSSPEPLSERAGAIPFAAVASAAAASTPVEAAQVAASPAPPGGGLGATNGDCVDQEVGTGGVNVASRDATAESPAVEEDRGRDGREEGRGVEFEGVGVVLGGQGRGGGGGGASVEDDQRLSGDMEKEDVLEFRFAEEQEQMDDEEGKGGRFPDRENAEPQTVVAAASAEGAAAHAGTGSELLPAVLFPPEGEPGRVVAGAALAAAGQSIGEDGAMGAEEIEHEGEGEEERLFAPSAQDLNEKFVQVARRWAPILGNPALNGPDPSVAHDVLPETEAFKTKVKVLSAWFHRGTITMAPAAAAVASSGRQTVHGDDNGSARKATAAGQQSRHAVSAGSKTRRGGVAKAAAVGRGAGRRSGGGPPARKIAGRSGAGVDDGGSTSVAKHGADGAAAPKVRSRGSSGASASVGIRTSSGGGGGGEIQGRLGKPRAPRLSVSPPRPKLSASARASSAARMSAASSSGGGRSAPPAHRRVATAPPPAPAPVPSAVAPSSAKKRNPLIRGSSPPRPSRRRSVAAETGVPGAVADAQARGTLTGHSSIGTPARIARLRSRKAKASLVSGGGVRKASTAPAAGPNIPSSKNAGLLSSARARTTNTDVRTPPAMGAPPVDDAGQAGSGSRSALQVFGFDPAVSTSPHARGALKASAGRPAAASLSPQLTTP